MTRSRSPYVEVVVKRAGRHQFTRRAILVWEAAHGPVPAAALVWHVLDTLDDRLENLVLVTKRMAMRLNRGHFTGGCAWSDLPSDVDLRLDVLMMALVDDQATDRMDWAAIRAQLQAAAPRRRMAVARHIAARHGVTEKMVYARFYHEQAGR